jgi:hypothetical protein
MAGGFIYSPTAEVTASGGPRLVSAAFRPGEVIESEHLARLAHTGEENRSWRFSSEPEEIFVPPKLPPIQMTARPVQVKSIWGFRRV